MPRPNLGLRIYHRESLYDGAGKLLRRGRLELLDGSRRISSFAEDDQRGADEALAQALIDRHQPNRSKSQRAQQVLVTDVLAIYATEVVPGHARPDKTAQRLVQLGEWWQGKSLDDISGKSCRDYRDFRLAMPWKSAKPKITGNPARMITEPGVRRELEDLRAAVNYHRKEGYCREVVEVWLPPRGKKRERWLTRNEVARLLRVLLHHQEVQVIGKGSRIGQVYVTKKRPWRHLARWLLVALYTGSRAGVVGAASFQRGEGRAFVDLKNGVFIRLPEDEEEADNKLRTPVPLPERLLAHLRRWSRMGVEDWIVTHDGERMREPNKALARAVAEAGLDRGVVPHTARHTCATWMMLLGCDARNAAFYLGMSEKMLLDRYGHFSPWHQADTRARLDGRPTPKVVPVAVETAFGTANSLRKRAA